jgi:hypothetical protein
MLIEKATNLANVTNIYDFKACGWLQGHSIVCLCGDAQKTDEHEVTT